MGSMNTENSTNLKKILKKLPSKTVMTSKWLSQQGVNHDLQKAYERNGWIKRIGRGAYTKLDEEFDMDGAIYALQTQLGLSIHLGAMTVLNDKHGIMQNIPYWRQAVLFGVRGEKIPTWFDKCFKDKYRLILTNFLPSDIGMMPYDNGNFITQIPTLERALLEVMYLLPGGAGLDEAHQILEMMTTLRPKKLQELLENCTSIKTKTIFFHMAVNDKMPWVKELNFSKIDLGSVYKDITEKDIVEYRYRKMILGLGEKSNDNL